MAQTMIGVFLVVFVGALAYEALNRTKPQITEKLEGRVSAGLDNFLSPAAGRA